MPANTHGGDHQGATAYLEFSLFSLACNDATQAEKNKVCPSLIDRL